MDGPRCPIPHWFLIQQAIKYGYSITVLKLSIAAYRLRRTVSVNGVCANLQAATRGITAGSVLACIEMRLVVIEALDKVVASCIYVKLTCFVDDVAMEMRGSKKLIE